MSVEARKGLQNPEVKVRGVCELPDMGAGTQTQVPWKSKQYVFLMAEFPPQPLSILLRNSVVQTCLLIHFH